MQENKKQAEDELLENQKESSEKEDVTQEVSDKTIENVQSEPVEDENTEEGKTEKKDGKSVKSMFKKEKKEKKDPKDEQIEELKDKLMRTMAEFDNFRKRSEKEKSQMFEIGAKGIIERILPVIDNFERGLGTISEEEKENAFAQGIEKIYKQFVSTLEEAGVTAIEAVGKEFDPNLHNAVMHAEDEEFGENTISDEFQKGYMYKDTVVRHSMVKVVN